MKKKKRPCTEPQIPMLNNKKKNHYKNSNTQIVRSEKMLKTGKTKSKQMGKHKFTHTKIERSDIVVIGIYLFRTTLLETF